MFWDIRTTTVLQQYYKLTTEEIARNRPIGTSLMIPDGSNTQHAWSAPKIGSSVRMVTRRVACFSDWWLNYYLSRGMSTTNMAAITWHIVMNQLIQLSPFRPISVLRCALRSGIRRYHSALSLKQTRFCCTMYYICSTMYNRNVNRQ